MNQSFKYRYTMYSFLETHSPTDGLISKYTVNKTNKIYTRVCRLELLLLHDRGIENLN